jgi:hypothetical protein
MLASQRTVLNSEPIRSSMDCSRAFGPWAPMTLRNLVMRSFSSMYDRLLSFVSFSFRS